MKTTTTENKMKTNLNEKSILITGGTGSLGKALTDTILKKWPKSQRSYWYMNPAAV